VQRIAEPAAATLVPEAIDLEAERLAVHRRTEGRAYRATTVARSGDRVAPEALPELRVPVSAFFSS
jgi:hypothetical protein